MLDTFDGVSFLLFGGIVLQPAFVPGHVAVDLSLVQKQADRAERRVGAERTAELPQLGVLTVLVVLERLAIAGGIGAVFTLIGRRCCLLWPGRVLGQHVVVKFILALAGISTDLTHERLGLMSQLVAVQLVCPVTAVGTLVTLIPSGQNQKVKCLQQVLFCSTKKITL